MSCASSNEPASTDASDLGSSPKPGGDSGGHSSDSGGDDGPTQPLPKCEPISGAKLAHAWTAGSLERIAPTAATGTTTSAEIWAARGEYESFQIAVQAPAGGLTNATVVASDLVDGHGRKIDKKGITLFREHYVHVGKASPDWGGSNRPKGIGDYADPLIPFVDPDTGADLSGATLDAVPFSLAASQNQPIWVDVLVPRDAKPGPYGGTVLIKTDQGSACIDVKVNVRKFALPNVPSLKSSFLVWSAGSKATYAELLRNRIMPSAVGAGDERGLIDGFGLGAANLGFFSGADIGNCSMSGAPSVAQIQAAKAGHQKDLFLYDYSADEIGHCTNLYPTLKAWGQNLHAAGVSNLVTMAPTTALFDDGTGSGRSAVDTWVVLPVTYDNAKAASTAALAKGDAIWSYNTLVQDAYSPKWEIDFSSIDFRIQPGFIDQALGMSGILYWRIDRFGADPWNVVDNTGTYSSGNYPGEAVLVYPGANVGIKGVAPSMRLKWIRDGVDDYEYVELLKKLGKTSDAMAMVHDAATDWTTWTRDPAVVESARKKLGDAIDALTP
jgi:hypothetical protein